MQKLSTVSPSPSILNQGASKNPALELSLAPWSDVVSSFMSPLNSNNTVEQVRVVQRMPSSHDQTPPLTLLSSLCALREQNDTKKMVCADDSSLRDTTVLSDLSDEIQKVEARLAAIREEEAQLVPRRTAPAAPTQSHDGMVAVVDAVPIECRTSLHSVPCPTDLARLEILPQRTSGCVQRMKDSLAPVNTSRSTLDTRIPESRVALSTCSRGLCEPSPREANALIEPAGGFFSLATFLRPLFRVDIEIATGVFKKLEIFAGEDMLDVAKRFIEEHKLDARRALKPLHVFLMSLIENNQNGQSMVTCDRSSDVRDESKRNSTGAESIVTAAAATFVDADGKGRTGRNKVQPTISDALHHRMAVDKKGKGLRTTPRCTGTINSIPLDSAAPHLTRKAEQLYARSLNSVGVRNILESVKERITLTCSDENEKKPDHEDQKKSKNSVSSLDRKRNSLKFNGSNFTMNDRSGINAHKVACRERPNSASLSPKKGANHPEVVAVEVEFTEPTVKVGADVAPKKLLRNRTTPMVSRCTSADTHQTASSRRARCSTTLHNEVQMPTFKPHLAPRSELLVAQDAQRLQGGPTYARLHARTPKSSRSSSAVKLTRCANTPRILPYKRNGSQDDPVGQRLYEQAMDYHNRMQEKRQKKQQEREEEELRSLRSGPNINRGRKWSGQAGREDHSKKTDMSTIRMRSADLPRKKLNNVKSREEKELESCTFSPVINPASVRMFNMVVKCNATEGTQVNKAKSEGVAEIVTSAKVQRSNSSPSGEAGSVEERLMLLERNRQRRLEEERFFRETVDATTGRPLFRPFLGR